MQGVQIDHCLNILSEQLTHPELKKAIAQVEDEVRRGESLSESMSQHNEVFPELLTKNDSIRRSQWEFRYDYVKDVGLL